MARHSLFPNSVTILYTTNGHAHRQVLPVGAVAGSAPGWTLPVRVGSPIDWRTLVAQYALVMSGLISDADTIDSAELYTYEATDAPAEFLAAHPLDQAGTSVNAPVEFSQIVMPFKAVGGTSLRLTVLEGVTGEDAKNSFAAETDGGLCDYLEYVLGDDNFIKTRGGDFPIISLGWVSKENDKLRKKYFLNT